MFGAREAALPAIRTELGLSYAEIGLLLALPNVASALLEPAIGLLGDLRARRLLVAAGGIAYGIGLLLGAAAGGFVALLVAFLILYPASGAFISLSQASLMDADPDGRERNMLRWTVAGYVGALAGPVLLAGALARGIGWRPLFVAFGLLALAFAALTLRAPFPARPREPVSVGLGAAWRAIRRLAVLRRLLLLQASDLLLDVLFAFLALYLVDEAGLGAPAAALVVTAWIGAGLLGNLLVLRGHARMGARRYLRWSAALAAALFAAFLAVPATGAKLGLLLALAAVNAGWYPLLQAGLYSELPGRSGTAMAVAGAFDLVALVPPLGLGLLADAFGLQAALWALLLGPLILVAFLPREPG